MKPYFDDGQVTVYLADCLAVIEGFPEASVDLVITDPPYSSGARTDSERQVRPPMLRALKEADWFSHDTMTTWGFSWFLRAVLVALRPKLTPGAHLYLFCDWRQTPNVYAMLESAGYRVNHCLVWAKTHYGMGTWWRNQHEHIVFASLGLPAPMLDRGAGSVLHYPAVSAAARVHPTEKPAGLIGRLLGAVPGRVVFDPFMGSGPVLKAAKAAGRRAIGCDINPAHCQTAAERLAQLALPLEVVA